jgi:hypothetical protein
MPVTIRECPHCYTRVGFLADGLCPACGKNLSDGNADPTRTLLTVSRISTLVPVCIRCGGNTTRRVTVSKGTRSRAMTLLAGIGTVLGYCLAPILRGGFIGIISAEGRKKHPHQRVRVSIPLCGGCQRNHGVPEPHRVDFENATMSFVVRRDIAIESSQTAEPTASPNVAPPHR